MGIVQKLYVDDEDLLNSIMLFNKEFGQLSANREAL